MFGSALEIAGSAHAQPSAIVRSARSSPAMPSAAFIAEAAQRFDIPMNWIRAVMGVESSIRVPALSQGRDGPHAAHAQDVRLIERALSSGSRRRPRNNILAGTAYLSNWHGRYGLPGFLAAYNAGPTATPAAADEIQNKTRTVNAFVATNSICQGEQVLVGGRSYFLDVAVRGQGHCRDNPRVSKHSPRAAIAERRRLRRAIVRRQSFATPVSARRCVRTLQFCVEGAPRNFSAQVPVILRGQFQLPLT
jgi:hypothetical protein